MEPTQIRLLAQDIVHRIAAGEVVEGPASVIKELVENSIDAGATHVNIKIVAGGLELIDVADDGKGMSRADLEACCLRHATSKISSLEDLNNIGSLGFRGEALAALSAVADLEIISRCAGPNGAWRLARSGAEFSTSPSTHVLGTSVRVHRLFFNTPARLKFLKSQNAEASRCLKTIRELAVANVSVNFKFFAIDRNGELDEEVEYPVEPVNARLARIFGAREDILFSAASGSQIPGVRQFSASFLSVPHVSRHTKDIYLVVNGRCVEDRRLPFVLREAFCGLIEVGAYPRGAIFISVDSSVVDVNVHPQKREVRWNKEFPLYSLIYESIKSALVSRGIARPEPISESTAEQAESMAFYEPVTLPTQSKQLSSPVTSLNGATQKAFGQMTFSKLRVVGEIGAAWIVCEAPEGMILIDQHAAHERVRFHEFMKGEIFATTPLLLPLKVKVPLALKGRELEVIAQLERFGFEGTAGDGILEFHAEPKTARKIAWGEVFAELFQRLDDAQDAGPLFAKLRQTIASSLACHGSVRRGQRLTNDEIMALLRSLDLVDWNEFCPHGRPTWIRFEHIRLEEEFHRA